MIKTSKRYQSFLNNYEFYPNSVHFRIYSSKAIEKFKNVQSFQLNQIANGKYHFSHDRREILLLKYDMWSRWLYEIENLIIELSGNHLENKITKKDIDMIILLATKTADTYKDVMLKRNSESFDQPFVNIWLKVHEMAFEYMLESISELVGNNFEMVFIKIVDILIEVMQYTLYEIYELDAIICKFWKNCSECLENNKCEKIDTDDDSIFIIVTRMAYKCYDILDRCLITDRIKIYSQYFKFDEIYFKNYTDETIKHRLIDDIEDQGFKINYKKSITY